MQRDLAHLEDIVRAADAIGRFTAGHDLEYLLGSDLLQSALAYQLAVIGEAVGRVSQELRDRHPEFRGC